MSDYPPDWQRERAHHQVKLQHAIRHYDAVQQRSFFGLRLLFVVAVVCFLFYVSFLCLCPFLLLLPSMTKRALAVLLQWQCRFLLYCRGIRTLKHNTKIPPLPPGSLILGLREDPWQALFLFAHFPQLILIPRPAGFMRTFGLLNICCLHISWPLSWVSFPDQRFKQQQSRLSQLLSSGYLTYAYANEGLHHPVYRDHFQVSKSLFPFIDQHLSHKKPVYVCHIKNWSSRVHYSYQNPGIMSVDFMNISDLYHLKGADKKSLSQAEKALSVASFFGYSSLEWVS
ncbi:MAG: hypothetical protein VW378_06910 [bacterium]